MKLHLLGSCLHRRCVNICVLNTHTCLYGTQMNALHRLNVCEVRYMYAHAHPRCVFSTRGPNTVEIRSSTARFRSRRGARLVSRACTRQAFRRALHSRARRSAPHEWIDLTRDRSWCLCFLKRARGYSNQNGQGINQLFTPRLLNVDMFRANHHKLNPRIRSNFRAIASCRHKLNVSKIRHYVCKPFASLRFITFVFLFLLIRSFQMQKALWLQCGEEQSTFKLFPVHSDARSHFKFTARNSFVFHVTKESSPVASFGGVGTIVGDLAEQQALSDSVRVTVIMPRYGFIEDDKIIRRFKFVLTNGVALDGQVSVRMYKNVTYILISAPSTCGELWQVRDTEHMYDVPSKCRQRGFDHEDRDLYFSTVAAKLIGDCAGWFSLWESCAVQTNVGVLVHSAHNAPSIPLIRLEVRESNFKMGILYVMHDYNNEPYSAFSRFKLCLYGAVNAQQKGSVLLEQRQSAFNVCKHDSPGIFLCRRVHASTFISHADLIILVSRGMLKNLLNSRSPTAVLLRGYQKQGRLVCIQNWVTEAVWDEARTHVSMQSPTLGKADARRRAFDVLSPFAGERAQSTSCLILWTGRFDYNKGIATLPQLYTVASDMKCAFAVQGYGGKEKQLTPILRRLRSKAEFRHFPIYLQRTRNEQRTHGSLLRAAADVVMVTSANEAYGIVAAEALAYGAVPVVSDAGGLPEIIIPFKKHAQHATWTGETFKVDTNDWRYNAKSASKSMKRVILRIQNERDQGQLHALYQRLISSTPLVSRSVSTYASCIALALSLQSSGLRDDSPFDDAERKCIWSRL